RGGQGGGARPHEPPRARGAGHPHDLERAPRGPRHERPRAGDEPRPRGGELRSGRGDARRRRRGHDPRPGTRGRLMEAGAPRAAPRSRLARWLPAAGQELVVLGALVALMAIVGAGDPRYLSNGNLTPIFAGNAYIAVAAIGMSMVIISGNIDVSVGALIGVLGTITGTLAVSGAPVWLSWGSALVLGAVVNAFVGLLVAYARIPSIVVTLGMLS